MTQADKCTRDAGCTAHPDTDCPDPDDTTLHTTPRARTIAAIHAYADWLAEHPEIPAPNCVTAFHHTVYTDVPDGREVARRFAAGNDVELIDHSSQGRPTLHATVIVMDRAAHGLYIEHNVIGYAPIGARE